MDIFRRILEILDTQMTTPVPYGWFHLLFFAISIGAAVLLCVTHKAGDYVRVRRVVFFVAVAVTLLEIYKQINYSFTPTESGIAFDFQWYAFPFQFCSMPMYIGLLTGAFRKGRIHNALMAFLATYAAFAGVCVMFYPVQVFIGTVGINIQTMICHGSMITVGIYLLYSGYVKPKSRSMLGAMCVFAVCIVCAMILNEIAHLSGLLESETFNMFFISPYCEPSLPVYSIVQQHVAFPFCLIIYFAAFSLASYLILLIGIGAGRLAKAIKEHRQKKLVLQ